MERKANCRKKICFLVSAEFAVMAFLIEHLKVLSSRYEITLMVNTDDADFLSGYGLDIDVIPIKIFRKINLLYDMLALVKIYSIFKKTKFDAVHSVTPKAGLLSAIAAFSAGVKIRIHTFTGQVWVSKKGFFRLILRSFDKLISHISTHLIVDSPSQLEYLVNHKVVSRNKSHVFGLGSISGVDLARFKPSKAVRTAVRNDLDMPEDAIVFIYLGRLSLDKGVRDLAQAFLEVDSNSAYLLFVGPDEENVTDEIKSILEAKNNKLRFIPYTKKPEEFLICADILCLPSYREGFGNVVIEAAACGIPAIASNIYGIEDAVVNGKTGLLHTPGDVMAIAHQMIKLMNDCCFRVELGENAYKRVLVDFDSQIISKQWLDFYVNLLKS